jgi:hypothetical protein
MDDARLADSLLERELAQRPGGGEEMADSRGHLRGLREGDRCTHFLADRLGEIGGARLHAVRDPVEQRRALIDAGLREGVERAPGCSVAGSVTAWVRPPSLSTQAPSMKC